MPTFEPLRPRGSADDLTLGSPLESEPTFSPLERDRPAVNRPMVSNVGDPLPSPFDVSGNFAGLGSPAEQPDGQPRSFRSGALHNIGVNWAEGTSDEPRPFTSRLGFYDLDYDTKGRRGVELGKGTDYIEAANVFGRQFTRAELEKDDEGRKLIKLMEAQRTGSHQEAGFWKGMSDWNLGNVPWLGWMMDLGSTVSETISISKTMRKMQDGEAVSNHEAIAVRRFMLQQELESQRSTSYQIGSTIRSSIPFVVEIAGAAAMTAAAAKAGAWVGGAIAGIGSGGVLAPVGAAIGGAIGAIGGFIFGGGALLSKLFKGGAKKAATKMAVNPMMEKLAGATFTEGISRLQRREAVKFAADATGRTTKEISKLALQNGMARASENVGRELAEKELGAAAVKGWTAEQFAAYATKNASTKEIRKRAVFESSKWVGESFKDVADIAMDARLARTFLVNGDVANMVERGWVTTLEKAILDKVYDSAPRGAKEGFWAGIKNYWADRAAVRKGLDKLSGEDINGLKTTFLTSMMDKAAGRPSAVSAVTASISQSLGGRAVSKGYASDVAEYLVNNATRSFMLKYKGKGFVNGATRVARWVSDGILDGMLRWDTSIYHGAGTVARSGSVLGGKMAAFKEALKVSFVEAPVRGSMQLGMQMPMWPVAAAATGNDPRDFVVRGQLGTQATALQTGDRQMMDNARAIAIGSGLVEYISESSGRGFNIMMEGVASPVLKNAPFLKATKEVGSYMSRKLESVFGTQEMMKAANRSRLADAVSSYLGRKAAEGVRIPNITRTQVEQLVAGAKGVANVGEVLKALGMKSEKVLVKQAMMSQLGLSKMRAGMTYFVAHNMLERGLTPQKMAAWLQRVGYDGVIAEMAEERYGGFFQGLMGLDDSPSDSTMRDRWSAAMRGLFPDTRQLVVEATAFSFPAITQLTVNSIYSHLGRGIVQETLDDAKSVSVHQNTVPEFTMPVASAEGAQALAAYHAGAQALYDKATVGEGGEEKAWNDVLGHGRTTADSVDKELEQDARADLAAAIADIEGPEVDAAGNLIGLRKRAKQLDMTKDFDREIVEDEIEHILSHAGSAADAAGRGNLYGASQLAQKWLREEWTRRHATAEVLPTRAQAVKAAVANGSLKLNEKNKDISNPKVSDEEMEVLLREKAQRIIDLSNNEDELNKQLADHQAEEVFGADGVEAIKKLKRKDPNYMDEAKKAALGEGSEYAEFVKNVPNVELRSDADADSVASEITAALPFISNDSAMTAEVRERLSVRQGVQFNKFSEDYVGEVAGSLGRLGDKYIQFKYNLGRNQWWGRRAMMRVIGILDAITTGRLELASRNPVQWAMEEAQLPRQLMNDVGQLRERAIQAGRELYLRRRFGDRYMEGAAARKIRETPLADTSADLMEEFRKAGEESYHTSLREYAQMFLTARNVIAVSKGDIEDAALRVVAHNHRDEAGGKVIYRYGDKTTDDFRSAEFRAAVAGDEMEKAKSDIVKGLARLAVSDAVAINTHARFGNVNTTSITFSYDRAMRFGNNAEVVAAIRAMPAFRNMRAVYDVSDGGHVNDYALGRAIDVGELLNLNTDGMLEPGDLRRVMFAMGRYYGEFTEAQNQQAAAQYLSRLRLAVENSEPLSFEFRDGTSADVKTSYGLDKDGRRVVTLTCNGVSVTGRSTLEATRLLETAAVPKADGTRPEVDGVLANWRQFAVLQNDSISSRDATSLVLLMHGTREKAREAYRAFYGHDVDETLYPPQLRRVTRDGAETWLYEDDEEAARGLATELRSEDKSVRNAVRGTGREGDPMSIGYERAAELMLERHGITRSKQDAASTDVYRGEASYSIRPNGIAFGDTIYLQSDYYSGGDAEMLLRSAFARAIFDAATKPGKAFDDPSAFVGILQEMDRAFTKAADECVAELEDRNPDMAQRVKDAMASLPSSPGRVDPARMAAIAAAVGVFSDERGVNEYGNGFLFGPELAYVADRARRSPWTLLFLSSMDEALGGRGFFAENAEPLEGLGRFLDAFAPSGPALIASRSSSLFTNGGEGARKTGIVFQWYGVPKDISAAGIAAGIAPVVDESTLTIFNDLENHSVSDLLRTVASHCREFGDAYRKAGGALSNAEMYRILKHALAEGGETADEAAPSIGSGFGGVSLETDVRVRQPLASDVVPDDVAFGIGRNLQFFAPGAEVGGVGGRAQALKSRSAVRRFLFERGCYSSNVERIVNKFIDAAGAEGGAGVSDAALDEEEWTSLADVLSDGSGNQDIFFDAKRTNAALENRDLMDLGRQWSYVYPSEGGAFTQVLARFSNEILRIAEKDGAADELKTLAGLFNVLRSKRSGKSGENIAAATGVWNDSSRVAKDTKVTDALLAKAVASLHESGHDELAFVLNGIRNIPANGKRRAQALALIGYMTPLDVNRVTVGDTGIGAIDTMGSASLAAVSSVRASLSHALSRMFPRAVGGRRTTPDELYRSVSVLDNLLLLSGSEKFFEKDKAGTPFAKLTIAEYESILAKAREGSDAKDAFMKRPSDDKALVAFANALASRMSAVADAVDYVLGPGNELTYALRSPDIVGGVVRSVRNAKGDALKAVVDRFVQLFDSCAASKESGSRCPLVSHALLNPAIAAIQRAVAAKGAAPLRGRRQYSDITTHGLSAVDILNALSDDHIARLFSRGDPMPQGAPRSQWFKNKLPGGVVNSYMGRVFGLYAASAPRSVARMSGVREESLEASSQVTATPASEPVMMAAVEDRLLANLAASQRTRDSKRGPLVQVKFTTTNSHREKDERKFNQLGGITKFIGFGTGSTGQYAKDLAGIANKEDYTSDDIVGVSVNGKRAGAVPVEGTEVERLVRRAAAAGATIITDAAADRVRDYNSGERALAALLGSLGYDDDGTGVWYNTETRELQALENSSKTIGSGDHPLSGVVLFRGYSSADGSMAKSVLGTVGHGKTYGRDYLQAIAGWPSIHLTTSLWEAGGYAKVHRERTKETASQSTVPVVDAYRIDENAKVVVFKDIREANANPDRYKDADVVVLRSGTVSPDASEVIVRKGAEHLLHLMESSGRPISAPAPGSSVLDDYLARGGRFEDGSRLVTVTAGARLEDGTIVDKSQLSVIVAAANIDRFVKGDVRNGYFEVYHGEKPSVYSISLPRDVMQKILDGIHSGVDWAMNRVTRKMVEDGVLPKTIEDPDHRGELYDALFSVVATAARCDQIDPKRTQVLLAQGVPFSTHRDKMLRTVDGEVSEVSAAVSTMNGKEKVTPGLYCDIIVSGTDATQNLGMYLNHGFLIEAQRAQATNPASVSFKNHLIDWFGAALFKGQGHDFGLGMYETDAVPVSGTLAEACRVQRRRLEEILGIKELTLDLPDPEKPQTDEEKAYRESALKLVEEFLLSSTTLCTDTETLKAGSFSEKCGFSVDGTTPFTVKVSGKELTFSLKKDDNGNLVEFRCTVDDTVVNLLDGRFVVPSFKNSSASLATMLPIIAQVLGKKELTAEDVGSIEAVWRLQTGEATEAKALKDSGIFQSYGDEEGDKASVVESASGGYRVRYFTRSMNAQVMANSDASAKPSLEHPAATNWARDVVANSGRVRQAVPGQADFTWYTTKALNVSRTIPYAILRSQPDFVRSLIERDPELYAAWMAHPNSQEVQEQIVRRANTAYAKSMRAYVNSMHAVLMGSGIKASTTRNPDGTYDVFYSYSAGVTDYDRDCFRDARVLSQEEKDAFGVGRSYSSGQVNVQSANFRYGWHLAPDADLTDVVKFINGSERGREKYTENLARLFWAAYGRSRVGKTDAEKIAWFEATYGPASEDMKTVAYLATYIEYFDDMKGARKEVAAKVLGRLFTDYTGRRIGENASCDLMKVSFADLFLGERFGGKQRFDLAAFEFRGGSHGKKYDRNGDKTIYLGGAFFAGDRRPSGNFESAGGLIRVQSPVLFDRTTGKVDGHALYILPPLMNSTQGSDTDGDSATGTVMSGKGLTTGDRAILDQIHDTVMARMKDPGSDEWARLLRCEDLVNTLRTRFPDYFEEETDENGVRFTKPSAKFHQLIGNVLLQEEIDNYRLMPNEVQDAYRTKDANQLASSRTVYDFGLVGRSPVGTQAVSDDIDLQIGGAASRLASMVLGVPEDSFAEKSYYSVFKKCVDKLSMQTIPKLDLLNPRVAAYLSGAAADANGARGVMVSLQAALEHLKGYADVDPRVRELAPALFAERDGYRPAEDFIGHLDKISNALFDVVKDLFAPRAGWQKGLLNCLMAKLLSDANAAYAEWESSGRQGMGPQWDDEWFFIELVGFARDLHSSDTSLPSLIAKGNAFFDHAAEDAFLPEQRKQTLLGAYNDMILGRSGCVAKTAFKGLYMVRDGRLDLTSKGRPKDVSKQYRLREGLNVMDEESGEMVPAHGADVQKGIAGLMSSIARALRMRESDFADAEARDRALGLGWRPATDFMDEALCDAIADVMEGKVDGRTAVRDRATKIAIGLRFLSATDVNAALAEAQRELRALQTLNDIMEAEDGLSPETALRNGGTKAAGHLGKMERAQKGGAAVSNEMELVYLGSKLRFEDIASGRDPLAADRSVRGDLDAVELSPSDWSSYLSRTGQRPMSATNSQGNPANDEALLFMAAASFAGDYVDTGVVQANRLNLSHLLGCIHAGVQKFGGAQYSQFVLGNYGKFASALNTLVEEALNRGTAAGMSQNVVDMLTMLRPNVKRNTVDLVIRASADAAKVLRAGFQELAANQTAVGGGFTGAGLAACIQLSMCANSQFDPARDSNVRANISAMFGEEVDEWERWGAAVPQNPVLRQLCRVPRTNGNGYNLFAQRTQYLDPDLARKVAAVSGMPEVTDADLNHPATQSLTTPFAILNYIAMTDYTSPHALHDEAAESDPRFLPGGEQRRRVTSVYAEGESHALRPQTSVPNVMFRGPSGEFQTVEEAVNDIMRERLASYASDKRMAAWLADPRNLTRSFNQTRLSTRFADESDREMYAATGRAPRGAVRKVPLNFDNVIDEVLERAWIDYGEQFAEWARNAAFDGGETFSEIASPLMRGKLKAFVQAHAETALEAPSIGTGSVDPSFTVQRMKRGGFFQFLEGKHPEDMDRFVHDPEANIRGALEAVFGDWSKETGCKVERVTGKSGVPMNLIRVTRKVKDAKGVHEVTTYISYGDYLSMKANNANYNQAILNALNDGAARQMTMDELMSLTEEERVALANAAGLRVKGESVKASKYLGTQALMALTGLVRLSDVSDYHTLFHEYFHQMLDFYRKTGICTTEDESELLKKYRTADGRFDEEAAADAFADYVTRTDEGPGRGKVLSAGFGGDDKLFAKFKHTAQAFLSGALAYDAGGMPVFMNMMISADFSQRDMKEVQDFDDAQKAKVEKLLLGEEVDFGAPSRWQSVDGELKNDGYDIAQALALFRLGHASDFSRVKAAAAKFVEDGKKPENRVTFTAIMNIDRPPAQADVAKPEPGPTLAQRISDSATPVGDRVSLLFKEALKRLGNGTSESADLTAAMNRFRDLSDIGEAAGPDFDLATYTARRALNHVCEMLGVNIWDYAEDGTKSLNELGRQLMSDEKIAGFIVRLVHEYSVKRKAANTYKTPGVPSRNEDPVASAELGMPMYADAEVHPAQFASADYVMGNMLAGVVPSKWTEFCRGRAEASRDLFIKAAEDMEARASAMRARFPDGNVPADTEKGAKNLELQAADARHRAHDVVTFVTAVMNGAPLKCLIPMMGALENRKGWSDKQEESNYYGYILQYITGAARMERQTDGSVKYVPGQAFGFSNATLDFSSRFVQEAIDAAAKALGVAQVVRSYVKENGVDMPAPGEEVSIPVDANEAPLATPPAEGVMEPDLHPQLILQLPGSWQASDLQKQFYGGSFRDMMTDVSLNSAVEETNRLANRIDFYLGANCMPGESANEIEEETSELGMEDGLFTVEEKNRHSVRRVAGVRGYMLGLVNRAAKTKGRVMTREDVNLVHFVSQAVACQACGHAMYTGYDIPYVNRTILDGLLANVKNVAELEKATAEGGVYSPEAVFDRIYGHVSSAGRPSNLDQLLCRMLEGVPRSVLGWEDGKFRKDGIYCKILEAFFITGRVRTNGTQVGDADFHHRVAGLLIDAGLADKSAATGRVVLTIPVAEVKRAWEAKDSYRQELIDKCGRRAELLDIDYLAEVVAAEANRLNKVAGRSRWLTDSAVGTTLSGMARGLWFEAGTGHHQAIVDHLKNARELFRGEISSDERLRNAYEALQDTLRSHNKEVTHRKIVTGPDGTPVEKPERAVQGELPAFELGRDGQLANISNRQLLYLGRLLGLGRRMADVDTFIKNIFAGNFTKEKTGSIYGFDIRKDMTVFEFDRLVFDVISAHIVTEAKHPDDPGHTPLTQAYDEGGCGYGHQQLVDIYYLHGQLQQKLMDDAAADRSVRGRVCSMSEQDMFRTQGKLGSSKSATERLRSMAEAITHAERFRGCLAQMLTTVGSDGAPNFIVKPGEYAQDLVPDEFWQATSRFVLDRMRGLGEMVAYDAGKTGLENMRVIADAASALVRDASKGNAKSRYHLLPPNELGAESLFDSVLCANDEAGDDVNILTKFSNGRLLHPNGSEAEGYMRQLFGMVSRPTVWSGHRVLDRVMSYSKAASVGLSAFFAFATRFESPVAACGFWNTAMGYRKSTAKLARRLADSKFGWVRKTGEALGFRKNLPYLADFLEAITSDDPAIQYMRELCDMINMPLTDSVMNPLTEKQGAIDADIDRISRWLMAEGHTKMAKELRSAMKAAFHNPGEYAFSNVLNGVKMAVVAQTMFRLREECERAGRPFDPVRELRKHSAYINAEIGGIQPERYAFLTPGMQQLLRLGMFSYQWTLGAWVAGSGEVVSDILFGGHHTNATTRRQAFIRWLRMLGIVKIGVPVFMQLVIKSLATALVKSGTVGDPDDPEDKDPLGIDDMPWLCFYNESKVGSLAFDVTPITKLLGRNETLVDIKNKRGAWPVLTSVLGTTAGAALTRKWWGALAGGFAGRNIGALIPASEGVGRGANTTGRRRQYMHFGKQNDEFWRWFTDGWTQATGKMSIPLQKVVEAFFGSTNGQNFGKKFAEKSLTERFFTTSLDPNESAIVNFLTGFAPFSVASVAGHPDTGVLGMVGPVNQGTSKTRSQKEIRRILTDFVRDDRHNDPWSFPGNRKNLAQLCAVALKEARMNGLDPDELLTSALGQVTSQEYIRLFEALPRTEKDEVDARTAKAALRALYRVNRKKSAILQSLKKKYKNAGVDWSKQKNAAIRAAVKDFLGETRADPWVSDDEVDKLFEQHFAEPSVQQLRSVDVQQDRKGGEAFANFLATDDVPETLFGIPVVSQDYTDEDLEFFKRNPKAAGFYDLGDEGGGEEPPPDEPPPGGGPVQGALRGGTTKRSKEARPIEAPTLVDEGRSMYFDRDASGKITGYGTTRSMVHEDNGKFFVIPTIVDNGDGTARLFDKDDARGWYSETGEHWGSYATREEADAASEEVHRRHVKLYQKAWNEFIQDHWDEMADSVKKDPGVAALHKLRAGRYPGAWNNPGNVKPGSAVYDGENGTHTTKDGRVFLKFKTPQDGLNAMAQVVGQIARQKIPQNYEEGNLPSDKFTLGNLLKIYAPEKDSNNTNEYTSFVAGKLGVDREAELDMDDAKQMAGLLEAMTRRDSGHPHADWFRPADYASAVKRMSVPARERKGGK